MEAANQDQEERPVKIWSVGLSGLSGMDYKVLATSFDEALVKTRKLAVDISKEEGEGFVREIQWIALDKGELVQ